MLQIRSMLISRSRIYPPELQLIAANAEGHIQDSNGYLHSYWGFRRGVHGGKEWGRARGGDQSSAPSLMYTVMNI